MGLFQVYLDTLQHRTGHGDISTKWSKTKELSGRVGGHFSATKHYHLSQVTNLSCQTKYTRCIYGKNRNKLCVTGTEQRSLPKCAVCPRARKPIKVSVCTNLPMMWMCSFFPLLLPASAPSKDQWVRRVLTLNDAWPLAGGTEPGVGVFSLHEAD